MLSEITNPVDICFAFALYPESSGFMSFDVATILAISMVELHIIHTLYLHTSHRLDPHR